MNLLVFILSNTKLMVKEINPHINNHNPVESKIIPGN